MSGIRKRSQNPQLGKFSERIGSVPGLAGRKRKPIGGGKKKREENAPKERKRNRKEKGGIEA